MYQGLILKDVHLRLEKLVAQSKCGALVAFMNDLNGSKRCIKLATTTISVNANVVAVLDAKILLINIIRLLGDLSHSLMYQQTLLSINNINSHCTIQI
jgi:hypothetical protein